jgi:hypothetical protein
MATTSRTCKVGHDGDVREERSPRPDIVLFAGASGDNNAMHINEEFAATTPFKGRIAHGMLSASVISAAIANRLPGPGTVYMKQSLEFRRRCGQATRCTRKSPCARCRGKEAGDPRHRLHGGPDRRHHRPGDGQGGSRMKVATRAYVRCTASMIDRPDESARHGHQRRMTGSERPAQILASLLETGQELMRKSFASATGGGQPAARSG